MKRCFGSRFGMSAVGSAALLAVVIAIGLAFGLSVPKVKKLEAKDRGQWSFGAIAIFSS